MVEGLRVVPGKVKSSNNINHSNYSNHDNSINSSDNSSNNRSNRVIQIISRWVEENLGAYTLGISSPSSAL